MIICILCFLNFFGHLHFCSNVLVQFCIILVRNGMFYEKHKSSYLVINFHYVIDTVYIYSWKIVDKILTHFGDALCLFFLSHVVFNMTTEWTPRAPIPFSKLHCYRWRTCLYIFYGRFMCNLGQSVSYLGWKIQGK